MDKLKWYNRKLRQIVKRLDKLEITTQQGGRLCQFDVRYVIGNEISPNKILIAKEILSKFGINEPKIKE